MIKKIILFLLIQFYCVTSFSLDTMTGVKLLDYCKIAIDFLDNNYGRVQTDSEYLQGTKAGICEGYLTSVNEFYSLPRKGEKKLYCMPENYEISKAIAVVVKYLKDNPKQLDLPATILVLRAYERYFLCMSH
ncbi:MAG: Rap1a/Tai family immunity protein [Gammaproteobacteria bacterium]